MDGEKLQITKLIGASPARVFEAWTSPELMRQWFAPEPMTANISELDARPGGRFRVEMHDPSGGVHTAAGTYKEVENGTRLVFSWSWEGSEMPETQVTVDLKPHGEQTELVLTHEGFPSAEAKDQHLDGWSKSTSKLAELMS
ncbi:MAG: SRPBCC domain-containing protein [Actinomycetota bacterium]